MFAKVNSQDITSVMTQCHGPVLATVLATLGRLELHPRLSPSHFHGTIQAPAGNQLINFVTDVQLDLCHLFISNLKFVRRITDV